MNFIKEYENEIKNFIYVLISYFITVILHLKFIVINPEAGHHSFNLFINLQNTFLNCNFLDILSMIAIYFLVKHVYKNIKKPDMWAIVLAIIFSVLYVVCMSYSLFNSGAFIVGSCYNTFISIFCIIGYFLLFYLGLEALFIFIDKIKAPENYNKKNDFLHKHFLLSGFITISTSWSICILLCYPGSFCYDAQFQLMQYFNATPFTSHHPPLSTFLMGGFVSLGDMIFDKNFGMFLYLFCQTLFSAWVFSYAINKLYEKNIKLRNCAVAVLFFALVPFWCAFAQWFEKDLLYATVVTLFLVFVIDIVVKNDFTKKDFLLIFITGIFASLLRNNGIYAVMPTVIALIFYFKNFKIKKLSTMLLALIIAVYAFMTGIVYPNALHIKNGSKGEMLSIPFQQTARYIVKHSNDITIDEKNIINKVLKYDEISSSYIPYASDPVKDLYLNNDNKLGEYFILYTKMFFKHPVTYSAAFVNMNYGFLAPVRPTVGAAVKMDFNDCFPNSYAYVRDAGFHKVLGRSLSKFYNDLSFASISAPIIKYLFDCGFYAWILMICIVILLRKKIYYPIVIFIPLIINLLVCIASPLCASMRYSLPLIAAIPFILGWVYYFITKNKN